MMKAYTLEISEKPRIKGALNLVSEPVLEVDYDKDFFILEVRSWSEYFDDFVPVSKVWLEKYRRESMEVFYHAIREHYEINTRQNKLDSELSRHLGK